MDRVLLTVLLKVASVSQMSKLLFLLVEQIGIEPTASSVRGMRSPI